MGLGGDQVKSSCADLIRASTPFFPAREGVDGRVKPGQDELEEWLSFLFSPQKWESGVASLRRLPWTPAFPTGQARGLKALGVTK